MLDVRPSKFVCAHSTVSPQLGTPSRRSRSPARPGSRLPYCSGIALAQHVQVDAVENRDPHPPRSLRHGRARETSERLPTLVRCSSPARAAPTATRCCCGLIMLSIASLASTESGPGAGRRRHLAQRHTCCVALARRERSRRLILVASRGDGSRPPCRRDRRRRSTAAAPRAGLTACDGGDAGCGRPVRDRPGDHAPRPSVTFETVLGALCIYLLLGMLFAAGVLRSMAQLGGSAFFVRDRPSLGR